MTPFYPAFPDDTGVKAVEKQLGIADTPMRMGQLIKCVQADVLGSPQDTPSIDVEPEEPRYRWLEGLMIGSLRETGTDDYPLGTVRILEGASFIGKRRRRLSPLYDVQMLRTTDPKPLGHLSVAWGQTGSVAEQITVELTAAAIDNICELLRQLWLTQTANESSMARIYSHPAFEQIVGLGQAAIPFMYRHLADEPELWSVGLSMVTGSDAAAGAQSPEAAVQAWEAWRETHLRH